MQSMSTIGLDIAKSVFQVHGVDAAGRVVMRRQLRRGQVLAFFQKLPPCLVGIEACASSPRFAKCSEPARGLCARRATTDSRDRARRHTARAGPQRSRRGPAR